jgi:hypothetical protein
MNIKPILFSTPMVQSILEGRKTMTRRIIKPQPLNFDVKKIIDWDDVIYSLPKYKVGDILWLRETWGVATRPHPIKGWVDGFEYKADCKYIDEENDLLPIYECEGFDFEKYQSGKWKPSLFMPKEACRLFLKITNVKVERLQDISEKDAKAEGVESCIADRENFGVRAAGMRLYRDYDRKNNSLKDYPCNGFEFAKTSFETLWQSINGEQSWNDNPYVWVLEFEQCEKPLNFLKQ